MRSSKYQTTLISLILSLAVVLLVWAFNPPTTSPPGGSGAIAVDASGNVGIGTITPGAKLDVNGTVVFRGLLDVSNSRIINLANPTALTDATTKDYVDKKGAVGGSPARLWGEGRPGATVINSAGQCTNLDLSIKISRSNFNESWGSSASVCPAGWWVCTANERDVNGATAGYGACGSGSVDSTWCDTGALSDEFDGSFLSIITWVADLPSSNSGLNWRRPMYITTGGTAGNSYDRCSLFRVWCCSNV